MLFYYQPGDEQINNWPWRNELGQWLLGGGGWGRQL